METKFLEEASRRLREHIMRDEVQPGLFRWQLSKDRKRWKHSIKGEIDLPPLPHSDYCQCIHCYKTDEDKINAAQQQWHRNED